MSDKPWKPTEVEIERATQHYLRRQGEAFLECAINLIVTTHTLQEASEILRRHADMIDELG